jgi:hypothetical protein
MMGQNIAESHHLDPALRREALPETAWMDITDIGRAPSLLLVAFGSQLDLGIE